LPPLQSLFPFFMKREDRGGGEILRLRLRMTEGRLRMTEGRLRMTGERDCFVAERLVMMGEA